MFYVKRQNNRVVKKIKLAKRVNLTTHYLLLATKYLKYDIKRNS